METFRANIPITKQDKKQQIAFGWAYKLHEADHSRKVFKVEDLEPAVYDYVLESRDGGVMHTQLTDGEGKPIAKLVESMMFTKEKWDALGITGGPEGWWVGYKVFDKATWARVESGELKMFSVGGRGELEEL